MGRKKLPDNEKTRRRNCSFYSDAEKAAIKKSKEMFDGKQNFSKYLDYLIRKDNDMLDEVAQ